MNDSHIMNMEEFGMTRALDESNNIIKRPCLYVHTTQRFTLSCCILANMSPLSRSVQSTLNLS